MPDGAPVEVEPSEAERIAYAYRLAARGEVWTALVRAIADALSDLDAAERRAGEREGAISFGYVRGCLDPAGR